MLNYSFNLKRKIMKTLYVIEAYFIIIIKLFNAFHPCSKWFLINSKSRRFSVAIQNYYKVRFIRKY